MTKAAGGFMVQATRDEIAPRAEKAMGMALPKLDPGMSDEELEAELDLAPEPEPEPAPEPTPDRSELVAATAADQQVDPGEVKKMISYLDRLFDQLPEDTIREFSKSEYFDLYKKIMGDLGLLK